MDGREAASAVRAGRGGNPKWSAKAKSLADLAGRYCGVAEEGRLADGDLRIRIVANEMDARCVALTSRRLAAESKAGGATNTASIMKNAVMRAAQERAELMIEIMGTYGLGWTEPFAAEEVNAVRAWLSGKSGSIWGGTNEIQNNIIAKRILGLPELTQSR